MRISAREACVRPHFHTRSEIKKIYDTALTPFATPMSLIQSPIL